MQHRILKKRIKTPRTKKTQNYAWDICNCNSKLYHYIFDTYLYTQDTKISNNKYMRMTLDVHKCITNTNQTGQINYYVTTIKSLTKAIYIYFLIVMFFSSSLKD